MSPRLRNLFSLAREYKFVSACVVLIVVAGASSYFFYTTLARLERQQALARDEGMAVLKTLASANTLRSDRAYIDEALKEIEGNLVTEDNLADNVGYFYKIEEQTHAHVTDLRQQPSAPTKPDAESRYKLVPVSFSVTGTFAQVIAFVHQVERGPRLMKITGFNVRRRQAGGNVVTMDLSLEMLGRP
ncbi:MAG TPA: type 4a pilus biogenesis protein PilO [Candidatus Didemnitutus sp.]|nr:type 4a pilus biogenesis protein PilO [Candidatus Didemnitutus sp.]